jgi:hypothetical protein
VIASVRAFLCPRSLFLLRGGAPAVVKKTSVFSTQAPSAIIALSGLRNFANDRYRFYRLILCL